MDRNRHNVGAICQGLDIFSSETSASIWKQLSWMEWDPARSELGEATGQCNYFTGKKYSLKTADRVFS